MSLPPPLDLPSPPPSQPPQPPRPTPPADWPAPKPRHQFRKAHFALLAVVALVASAFGIGISAPVIQADTTSLNVIISPPTGTIAVGETITWPVRIENPGTDPVTLTSYTSSLGDPVTCPTDQTIAAGDARLCSTSHVLTADDITNGTLDVTVDAQASVSACNVGPLTPQLTNTSGNPFEFTSVLENGVTVKGYEFNGSLLDLNGTEVASFHIQVESNGAASSSQASISGNDVTWQFDNVSDPSPPSRVRYVVNALADGFVSAGAITTDGMPPVTNGDVNDATGFAVGFENQATGAILLAEDQPDEVINANAGDTLTAGTVYDLTDTSVTGSEAPQYTVQYAFNEIAAGGRAGFWFNQYGTLGFEQHLLSLNLTGCSSAPVTVSGTDSNSIDTWLPAIDLVKNNPTGTLGAGQTVSYSFDVTNTGNVELANIALDDSLTADESCPSTTLAAGASMTCDATYDITQADVDAGTVDNTATITGYLPDGTTNVTDTASVSTPIATSGSMSVSKTASPAGADVGDTIDYSIVVTNTGDVTLTSVTITDDLTADESCPSTTIAPGGSITCTATYTITQADADAGSVSNTATIDALDPAGIGVTASGTAEYTVVQNASMSVVKAASPPGASVGDTIDYSIVVTNSGNVTLTSATIVDDLTADESCPTTPFAPGGSITCTATYTITQANADAGSVSNTATVTALDPVGGEVSGSSTNVYSISQTAALSLAKTGTVADPDGDGIPQAGDTITYTITVTNTGSVSVSSIVVEDPIGTPNCDATSIGAGESITCTVSRALTQTDIDAGTASNSAVANGTDPNGTPVSANGAVDTAIVQSAEVTVTKSTPTSSFVVGDTLNYTIIAHNTGNVTLTSLSVSDPMDPAATCPATQLAPDEQMACTASYVATQADVDAGSVTNTAQVDGLDPSGAAVSGSDTYQTSVSPSPGLSLSKTGTSNDTDGDGTIEAGETIDYSFVVMNTGNVSAFALAVSDPLTTTPTCDATELVPGQMTKCAATYTLTQADVDNGTVPNTATVNATDPGETSFSAQASTSTELTASPKLTVTKSGLPADSNDNGQLDAGEPIDYTITVTNTGNVTVDSIVVADPKAGTPTCGFDTLAPATSGQCTVSYAITQADINSGQVVNEATADGLDPNGTSVSASGQTTDEILSVGSLTVSKTGVAIDADDSGAIEPGESIDYTITVANNGNVTLTNLVVQDLVAGNPACDVTVLAPGAQAICSVSMALTQAQIDAGEVVNTANATASDPNEVPVTGSGGVTTTIAQVATLNVAKSGTWVDANDNGVAEVGESVDFTVTVTNTGNVSLTDLAVDDPTAGTPTCGTTQLVAGQSTDCVVSYVLTQADVDSGGVTNTATAQAVEPMENSVQAADTTTVSVVAAPALSVSKSGSVNDADTDGIADVGESIDYTITVTNTGNVSIGDVAVADPQAGTPTCDVNVLAAGEVATCTVSYTITEADILAGSFANSASASGIDPNENPVSASGGVTVALDAVPQLSAVKTGVVADVNGDGVTGARDRINYTITVTNDGNVTVSELVVTDPTAGSPVCDATVLAPGGSTDCTVSYVLTQGDVDWGSVPNSATAAGTDPFGDPVETEASTVTTIVALPSIEVTKSASVDTYQVGSVVYYSIVVRNTGNVTVSGITIDDALTTDEMCPMSTLGPLEQMVCSATHTLTQADLDGGSTENTVEVSALSPSGVAVSASDTVTTPYIQSPSLSIAKTATVTDDDTNGKINAGDSIGYVITVTNNGNVSVTSLVVSDPLLAEVTCDVATLAPGMQATCGGTYLLNQFDINSGVVSNTASVVGKDPNLADVAAEVTIETAIVQEPTLLVDATAVHNDTNTDGVFQAGETIDYSVTVTNTGNVSLASLTVSDSVLGTLTCDVGALAPGESATCDTSLTLAQSDVDAGQVNVAPVATALDPAEAEVSASDTVNTSIPEVPGLVVLKSADVSDPVVGDTITYTITVANSGNVTVADIVVTDELTSDETCSGSVLAPGESLTCGATYVVTQADVDAGSVVNTAAATGVSPSGSTVEGAGDVTTPFVQSPAIDVVKSATWNDSNEDGIAQVDETIDYVVQVTNTGNVTVVGLTVDDPTAGRPVCATTVLAPGDTVDCVVSHVLTYADIDSGGITNNATVTVTAPDASELTGQASVTTPLEAVPGLSLTKVGWLMDGNDNGVADARELMDYRVFIENTGNVSIFDVVVEDSKVVEPGCDLVVIRAGERIECFVVYELTQADIDTGEISNSVFAVGATPDRNPIEAQDTTTNNLPAAPSIDLVLSTTSNPATKPGAVVEYAFVVTNNGNVTLINTEVSSELTGRATCPSNQVAPGDQMTCTATYTITQADLDAGDITNTAVATGTAPDASTVTDTDSAPLPVDPQPSLALANSGQTVDVDGDMKIEVGDLVEDTLTITSDGNTTVSNVVVLDPDTGEILCGSVTLLPGQSTTCTVTQDITRADIDAGAATISTIVSGDGIVPALTNDTDVVLPMAGNDAIAGRGGETLFIDVLANDSRNLDGESLRLVDGNSNHVMRLEVPGEGVWTVTDGMLSFNPDDGFSGRATPVMYMVMSVDGVAVAAMVEALVEEGSTTTTTDNNTTTTTVVDITTTTSSGDFGVVVGDSGSGSPPPITGSTGSVFSVLLAAVLVALGAGLLLLARARRSVRT